MFRKPVELFHVGPPKTATTWLFHCLKEHPQISTSKRDAIHYFDIHHALDVAWYDNHFIAQDGGSESIVRFDPTYSYICCPAAIKRISQYNPDAKIVYCLRNPVDRAFSHYWHIKKKICSDKMVFEDILLHYNNYATWMEHGLLAPGMKAIYDYFPKDNVQVIMYEDQQDNPEIVWKAVTGLAGIDGKFIPKALHKKINAAGAKQNLVARLLNKSMRTLYGEDALSHLGKMNSIVRCLSGKSEYLSGMDSELEARLYELIEPDIAEMERFSGIDLSHWRYKP